MDDVVSPIVQVLQPRAQFNQTARWIAVAQQGPSPIKSGEMILFVCNERAFKGLPRLYQVPGGILRSPQVSPHAFAKVHRSHHLFWLFLRRFRKALKGLFKVFFQQRLAPRLHQAANSP